MVTENPLEVSSLPKDAEIIPFPNEDVTPPVTKIYFVGNLPTIYNSFVCAKILFVSDYS